MYFFDKKTEYLIWKMQEGQARGVGTVRFLVMDEVCRMEVAVTGCAKLQGTYPVYVLSGHMQSMLGDITIHKGRGNLSIKCKTSAIGHQAFPYTQITGVHIDLKTEGCLEQKWLPVQGQITNQTIEGSLHKKEENVHRKKDQVDIEEVNRIKREQAVKEEKNQIRKEQTVKEEADQIRKEQAGKEETDHTTKEQTYRQKQFYVEKEEVDKQQFQTKTGTARPPETAGFQLHTNKWNQLCAIYPVVHPFGDGRAYLSIEPRDFVVLQERFQPMVQNSFLLHGFYHYRHLLLGRHKQGNQVQYYLGVPGVFYEKEKSAALFYGFESFEGAVTPTPEGSFGYYMKRVQI